MALEAGMSGEDSGCWFLSDFLLQEHLWLEAIPENVMDTPVQALVPSGEELWNWTSGR